MCSVPSVSVSSPSKRPRLDPSEARDQHGQGVAREAVAVRVAAGGAEALHAVVHGAQP